MQKVELPPIPRLDRPESIRTKQGIETLRCYMAYVCKKHNYRPVYPFSFNDMFNDAYAFLLERVDQWNPELSNFDSWATEMLRYGWLYAVRDMHWLKYRLIDKQHQIEGRHLTRFGVDEYGRTEQDKVADPSDEIGSLVEDMELEEMLSVLSAEDQHIGRMLLEGHSAEEIDGMYGMSGKALRSKTRIAKTFGLKRPPTTRKYHELSNKDKTEVLSQYEKLGSYKRVSERLGIHHAAVGKVVRNEA